MSVAVQMPARRCAGCAATFRPKRVGEEKCSICRLSEMGPVSSSRTPHPHSNLQCSVCNALAEEFPARDLLVAKCRGGVPHSWRERRKA